MLKSYVDIETAGTSYHEDARMPEYSNAQDNTVESEPVQLQPFIHQVGGHSCVLRFNETTLCKPLIARELVFYESLPAELKEFIPDFRGIVEVELQEDDDGQITLMGYPLNGDNSVSPLGRQRAGKRLQRSSPKPYERGTSPNSSGSETETSQSPELHSKNKHPRRSDNAYSVRLLRSGSIEVSTELDTLFNSPDHKSGQKSAGLNPWSLKCHKREVAKMRKYNEDSNLKKYILLENVAAKFRFPCILDLKMGTRQHGDDAPEAKKLSQTRKCESTTSSHVGLRLIGMQVYQRAKGHFLCQNKYYGRELSVAGFKESLELFLYDGEHLRLELLDPILNRLHNLKGIVEKQESFRFYSSSLLIMYGGQGNDNLDHCDNVNKQMGENSDQPHHDNGNQEGAELYCGASDDSCDSAVELKTDNEQVDVRMIDFAHSTHRGFQDDARHKGVDQGYLFGLKNLISIFTEIKQRYPGHAPENG
ncbi:inositol hexakisphosphate kinase 1-like isoform X1 [Mya arenaria]|nr:inositol hexakisphosphate kinase 1-like isoform X1 [Mya arenaria]